MMACKMLLEDDISSWFLATAERGSSGKANPHTGLRSPEDILIGTITYEHPHSPVLERSCMNENLVIKMRCTVKLMHRVSSDDLR